VKEKPWHTGAKRDLFVVANYSCLKKKLQEDNNENIIAFVKMLLFTDFSRKIAPQKDGRYSRRQM